MHRGSALHDFPMNIEELCRKHFPYDTPNPGQMEAIVAAVEAFERGVKHVIVQAPTGIGKSAIATTIHRAMREIHNRWRTTIITATKQLQDQYVKDDAAVFDLRGRTNYGCPHDAGPYNSNKCRVQVKKGCKPKETCPYVKRRTGWTHLADLRSTNFSFQIEAPPMLCMTPETVADLIVIDECHEIDMALIEHATIRVNIHEFRQLADIGFEWVIPRIVEFIDAFATMGDGEAFSPDEELNGIFDQLSGTLTQVCETLEEQMEESSDMREIKGAMVDAMMQVLGKCASFGKGGDEWILVKYENSTCVELKPVYAEQVAYHGLMMKCERFLHMSATICGFDQYIESLGLRPQDCHIIDLENPIPVKNRPVFVVPKFKVNASFNEWDKLVRMIDMIIGRHGKDNGIIHSVSFKLGEQIKQLSKFSSRMIVTGDRFEIADALSKPGSGAIIISPSIEKGVDLKGDMSRWQILPKVPYGYLGDPFIKLNADRHEDWYARRAILRMVQASGRSVRGVNDYADTYILDANFNRLYEQNMEIFPDWYRDSLEWKA
jgi:ATP-dependent DNA helicase DinG